MRIQLSRNRLVLGLGILGLGAVAGLWGRDKSISRAKAEPPAPAYTSNLAPQPNANQNAAAFAQSSTVDNSSRVVAYLYETVPLTWRQYGDYLIERLGAQRLDNFINHYIIDMACRQKGVDVTAAEVEAEFATMLKGLNLTQDKFEKTMLKPYGNKTLYEWKEDAIKPRLLLTKLCRDRVQVTAEDLQTAFEAHYGEKVDCRIIMWPEGEKEKVLSTIYPKISKSEEEFDRAARQQASPTLAAQGGRVEPFGRHTTGNEELERAAFGLQEGEMSHVVGTPQGPVVIKCLKHLPPQQDKSLADPKIHDDLSKEVFEKKLQLEIQKTFAELRAQANPKKFFSQSITEDELKKQVRDELQSDRKTVMPPHGN